MIRKKITEENIHKVVSEIWKEQKYIFYTSPWGEAQMNLVLFDSVIQSTLNGHMFPRDKRQRNRLVRKIHTEKLKQQS